MRAARGVLGLRGRLVAALMLMAVVTLGVAAVTVLSPLERRLRDQEVQTVAATTLTAGGSFADLDVPDLRPNSPDLVGLVRELARRTDGQVAVVDANGQVIANTDPEPNESFPEARRALLGGRVIRTVSGTGSNGGVRVAVPVDVYGHRFAVTVLKGLSTVAGAVSVVRRAFALAVVITLVLALALGLLIATRLVRRLRALRTAAMRVADLGPGVELHADGGRDEVGDLTRSFATMQKQLRAQEEARRTFVASASHELRTPLQSLLFMLDMIYEDLADEASDLAHAREDVGRARAQAERLCGLSAELLDLSRLDAGVALRRERVELVGLCRSVVAEFEGRAIEANALIELIPAPAAWVVADPSAVVQIIRGLLDNALRFTPPGGRISVTPRPGTIAVADEGPGVPTHERDLIFERFRRGKDGGGGGGFGLGLAIGRELARRMDGDLSLDGTGPGARFVLQLASVPSSATGRELAREASKR